MNCDISCYYCQKTILASISLTIQKMCYLVYKVVFVKTKVMFKNKWNGGAEKWLEMQIKALSHLFQAKKWFANYINY